MYTFYLFDKFWITFPSVVSDKLIFLISNMCAVLIDSYLFIFSEPAKSQRLILARWTYILYYTLIPPPTGSGLLDSSSNWKILWLRLLLAFILVCLIIRFFSPSFMRPKQSLYWLTANSESPSLILTVTFIPTNIPSVLLSWMARDLGCVLPSAVNKSYIFSLYICKKLQ